MWSWLRLFYECYRSLRFYGTVMFKACSEVVLNHYNDVIMGAIASQITSLTIVYSIVYSDADQRKHQSSASLAFVRGIVIRQWFAPVTQSWGKPIGKSRHQNVIVHDQKYTFAFSIALTKCKTRIKWSKLLHFSALLLASVHCAIVTSHKPILSRHFELFSKNVSKESTIGACVFSSSFQWLSPGNYQVKFMVLLPASMWENIKVSFSRPCTFCSTSIEFRVWISNHIDMKSNIIQ